MNNMKKLLGDIKNISVLLQEKFYLIGIEIENNFEHIKSCVSMNESEQYFDELQAIQEVLAELVYKENFNVPESLWSFIKEFDRLDDQDLRKYMYKEVKEGRYFFKRG